MKNSSWDGSYSNGVMTLLNERKTECPDDCERRCDQCSVAINQIPETMAKKLPAGVKNFEIRGPKRAFVVFRRLELLEA